MVGGEGLVVGSHIEVQLAIGEGGVCWEVEMIFNNIKVWEKVGREVVGSGFVNFHKIKVSWIFIIITFRLIARSFEAIMLTYQYHS